MRYGVTDDVRVTQVVRRIERIVGLRCGMSCTMRCRQGTTLRAIAA